MISSMYLTFIHFFCLQNRNSNVGDGGSSKGDNKQVVKVALLGNPIIVDAIYSPGMD